MIKKMNIIAFIAFVLAGTSFGNAMQREEDNIYGSLSPRTLDLDDLYDDNKDDRVGSFGNAMQRDEDDIYGSLSPRTLDLDDLYDDSEDDRVGPIQVNQEEINQAFRWFEAAENQEQHNRAIRWFEQAANQGLGAINLNISNEPQNNITQ